MTKCVLRVLGLALLFGCTARSAAAVPIITFDSPAQPDGMTFTIESVSPTTDLFGGDGNANDTFLITLRLVTTTDYVDEGGSTNYLQALGLNVSGSALDAGILDSFTATPAFGTPLAWDDDDNINVNASAQCSGNSPGSICVEDISTSAPNLAIDANATYDWVFKLDLPVGGFGSTTSLTVGISTIGATSGQFVKIDNPITYTEPIGLTIGTQSGGETAVPEPASLLLFGTGAAFVAARVRRRRQSSARQ